MRKLVPPLTELIETTPAMSLLYECIQTSIVGGMLNGTEGEALAHTCVEKLQCFLEDVDQNRMSYSSYLVDSYTDPAALAQSATSLFWR